MGLANMKRYIPSELIEAAICRQEGVLLVNGAFSAHTGKFTGRSPKDKYFVDCQGHSLPKEQHQWMTESKFQMLFHEVTTYLEQTGGYVFDGAVNQHESYRIPVRFYTEFAWHNLFVQQLFLTHSPVSGEIADDSLYTVYGAPSVKANPSVHGTQSETFVVIHPGKKIVLIGGTEYAGELKKSIFTLMHHVLAEQDVLPMHCSASVGDHGDVALFFGLSGTGKTTLSADPTRKLIGDDEHGWGADGVFNMENGCYAKCIDLSAAREPDIYDAIRFGAVLENVGCDENRIPDYSDRSLTENTRAAYPLSHIRNVESSGRGGHPNVIIFLSADATGVLPAVSRLSPEDVMRHFLLGYTSKLAGTERGVVNPEATFSACFGSPFLTDVPGRYAEMLFRRVIRHNVPVYLLSTGWVAGGHGEVGRMPLDITRNLVHRILSGELNSLETTRDDALFLQVPVEIPGVPEQYLSPKQGFANEQEYHALRESLAKSFREALDKFTVVSM
jgi:phosphoenolpyruvate carboxykinase (ATP)